MAANKRNKAYRLNYSKRWQIAVHEANVLLCIKPSHRINFYNENLLKVVIELDSKLRRYCRRKADKFCHTIKESSSSTKNRLKKSIFENLRDNEILVDTNAILNEGKFVMRLNEMWSAMTDVKLRLSKNSSTQQMQSFHESNIKRQELFESERAKELENRREKARQFMKRSETPNKIRRQEKLEKKNELPRLLYSIAIFVIIHPISIFHLEVNCYPNLNWFLSVINRKKKLNI